MFQQVKLFTQRDTGFFSQAQRHTQKFREQNAHFASFGGVDAGQGADGVEAVEQEMRIDLGLQGFEFCVAREDRALHHAGLRLTRRFQRQDDVAVCHGQQIQQEACAKQNG